MAHCSSLVFKPVVVHTRMEKMLLWSLTLTLVRYLPENWVEQSYILLLLLHKNTVVLFICFTWHWLDVSVLKTNPQKMPLILHLEHIWTNGWEPGETTLWPTIIIDSFSYSNSTSHIIWSGAQTFAPSDRIPPEKNSIWQLGVFQNESLLYLYFCLFSLSLVTYLTWEKSDKIII